MKKIIIFVLSLSVNLQFLTAFSGLPILKINYQAGVPLKFEYNSNATDTKITPRGKNVSEFSFPFTLNSDLGAILKFSAKHSLVAFINLSYESDPVNRLFDPGVYLDNKFNLPDITQEYLNFISSASHRWTLSRNFLLTSSLDTTLLAFGNGKGDFAGNLLNTSSFGINEEVVFFNWAELFKKKNSFLNTSMLRTHAGWHINWRPNDDDFASEANDILNVSYTNVSTNFTNNELSDTANVFADQKELFHSLNFGLEYNYNPLEDLKFILNWKINGDLYPAYLVNDTNGNATENNRRFLRNNISLRSALNAVYRGEKRYLFNFLMNFKIQTTRGNDVQNMQIEPADTYKFITINKKLEKDRQIGLNVIEYILVNTNQTNASMIDTNYLTNHQAFMPGYQDYNAFIFDPHISFNPSLFFKMDAGYSFAFKRYTGRYIKNTEGQWKLYEQKIHMVNLGMRFINKSGLKSIYPFFAMQFINSNDRSAASDIYYFGLSTSLEF